MRTPAAVVVPLACLGILGGLGFVNSSGQPDVFISITNDDGELASVPLAGTSFSVSYRNSLYGTRAEERYTLAPDGTFVLDQIAADQLAVLEEYYAVPGAPSAAGDADRREWVVEPDPARPAVFEELSIAATDLGQRTLHVQGAPPLELWSLVEDDNPFVELHLEETP
ncbi:hypothetical protein [Arthrobacter antioxidans]|uniref:hypothetical protein n=1 Tax=Arthrobacter antioxidans TaxID=2895818 RepID=UPI001FFE8854|nr:hypothetical protein [Arthrobacter antioxidans]